MPTEMSSILASGSTSRPYLSLIHIFVVLVLFVGRSVAPKADGVPYEKGSRG